jgi:alpha-L-fucosidase 2
MRSVGLAAALLIGGSAGLAAGPQTGSGAASQPPAAQLVREGPISRWDEAMPLGNGLQGALVWGEGRTLTLSLDRGDLWDARRPDVMTSPQWTWAELRRLKEAGDFAALHRIFDWPYDNVPYPTKLPGGRIELGFGPGIEIRRFTLDLARGEVRVDLTGASVVVRLDAVAEAGIIDVSGAPPGLAIRRPAGLDLLGYGPAAFTAGASSWTMRQEAALGLSYAIVVGKTQAAADRARFAFTIGAGRKGADPVADAMSTVTRALSAPANRLDAAHLAWWSQFWGVSSIAVPDSALQQHYDLVKYFYGAASRPDAPPMPLQGVWTADEGRLPPWKGDYHHDLNTQMTYLAYHAAGLTAQGESFLNQLWDLRPAFRRFAREFYGVDGLVVPGVMTLDGDSIGGWAQYSLSPTNTAWVAQSFYLHWKYTADASFLRDRAYPWCAEAGRALLSLMTPDESGRLTLPLSSSPEIFDNSPRSWLPPNSNYDLTLVRFLFDANREMAAELGDLPAARAWQDALGRMAPPDIDPDSGALTFARGLPYLDSHRHFSHAIAVYPIGSVHVEGSDADRHVVEATINQIAERGTRQWVGYSFSWMSAMAARAGQADRALEFARTFVGAFIGPNGFHLNGDQTKSGQSAFTYRPFTLEGNFLEMQALHEMLLQSWGGVLRVFPAVSAEWRDVSFDRLRAEGGFTVSARRVAGRTARVEVTARVAGTLWLRDPFGGADATWNRSGVRRDGRDYVVELPAGATLIGTPSRAPLSPRLPPPRGPGALPTDSSGPRRPTSPPGGDR